VPRRSPLLDSHRASDFGEVAALAGFILEEVLALVELERWLPRFAGRGTARGARIGRVVSEHPGLVRLRTPIGGERILDLPFGESLPRIC
jgi:hydrogenase maturation factor